MLRRQNPPLSTFSMSSMTDVVFLLLIFFMVTSTFIIPSALEVDLPQSSSESQLRPVSEVYIDSIGNYYFVADRNDTVAANREAVSVSRDELMASLMLVNETDSARPVALYADRQVEYGDVVEVLDLASSHGIKMVLATKPTDR